MPRKINNSVYFCHTVLAKFLFKYLLRNSTLLGIKFVKSQLLKSSLTHFLISPIVLVPLATKTDAFSLSGAKACTFQPNPLSDRKSAIYQAIRLLFFGERSSCLPKLRVQCDLFLVLMQSIPFNRDCLPGCQLDFKYE